MRTTARYRRNLWFGCVFVLGLFVQQLPAQLSSSSSWLAPGSISSSGPVAPLTAVQKFDFYLQATYGPQEFLKSAIIGEFMQARNSPSTWGRGWDGYGKRVGSSMGQRAVGNTIGAAVGIWHREDPRYFTFEGHPFKARLANALEQSLIAHTDEGGRTVSLGRITAAFGGGLLSRTWQPHNHTSVREGFEAGGLTLVYGAASNVFYEFWPDIRRYLHLPF